MLEQARPLYALRMMAQGHYMIAKFAMPDFTVEATYNLIAKGTGYACDCPASARVVKYKPCKHQRMLPFMLGAVNTDRFYEPESRSWCQPLAPDLAAAVAGEARPPVVDDMVGSHVDREPKPAPVKEELIDKDWRHAVSVANVETTQAGLPKLRRRV